MNRISIWSICLVALFWVLPGQIAGNWSQFRGAQSNNIVTDTQFPQEWGADRNIAWKFKVPGQGWSSPIVWDDKVFVTTAVLDESESGSNNEQPGEATDRQRTRPQTTYRWEVYCLDLKTGKELWKQVAFKGKPTIVTHRDNTYASETPVTDGKRLYVYFGMIGLYCYDLNGNLLWEKNLGAYPMQSDWGTATSPLLHGELLYMLIDNEQESFLAALDRKTGEQRWRVAREEGSNWSTPIIWKNSKRTELVTGGKRVRAYDPQSGKLFWELDVKGGRSITSPTAEGDLLYVGTEERRDGGGYLFAVKAGASGDITPPPGESTSTGVLWSLANSGIAMASPLAYKGLVYVLERRRGNLHGYDGRTGKPVFPRQRVEGAKAFWASPWAYDDKIFCLDDTGTTHVLQAGREFKIVTQNTLKDKFWASPAIAGGALILRGVDFLYCVQE